MSSQNQEIERKILDHLSSTPFACSLLTLLPQGTTNFVFRGTLKEPYLLHSHGPINCAARKVGTVIVKHVEKHTRLNPDLRLHSLKDFEPLMLGQLGRFQWVPSPGSDPPVPGSSRSPGRGVRVPAVLHLDCSTFVVEDLGEDTKSAGDWLLGTTVEIRRAAEDLGHWLKAFHRWSSQPDQQELVTMMASNSAMGDFRIDIIYRGISTVCEKVGLLDEDTRAAFKLVEELVAMEFAYRRQTQPLTAEWGPIHSDFWTGNILVPVPDGVFDKPYFSVIDWEFAHLGLRAYDLGHMIGDLVEKQQLGALRDFAAFFEGFVEGYGRISRETAFRVLVHAGAQLIGWYFRGPRIGLVDDRICDIVKLGRDMICAGIKKEEHWFHEQGYGFIFLGV